MANAGFEGADYTLPGNVARHGGAHGFAPSPHWIGPALAADPARAA